MGLFIVMKAAFLRALGSSKFQMAVAGMIAASMIRYFKVGQEQAGAIANEIVTLFGICVGAQGLADFGKEQKVVGTAVEPTAPKAKQS